MKFFKNFKFIVLVSVFLSTILISQNINEQGLQKEITDFSYRNTDFRDVIRSIATKYNLNIFVDNSITSKVTLHLSNVKVIDAIKFMVEENNLELVQTGNIIKILAKELPPPTPKVINVEYKNDKLSVDLKNEKVEDAIYAIAQKSGKTILLDKYVSGTINGFMQSIPFETGLRQLLENNGYRLQKNSGIYVVQPSEQPFIEGQGKNLKSRGYRSLHVEDSLITMDVQDAPLKGLVQDAARRLGKDIFIYGTIDGQISARVEKIKFDEFLNLIFQGSNYTYKMQNGIYLIGDKSVKGISTSELVKLDYLRAENISDMLPQTLLQKAEIKIITEQNGAMVVGTKSVINEIKEYISRIDKPSPQILIDALVIDFSKGRSREISIDGGYTNQNLSSDTSGFKLDKILPGIDAVFSSNVLNRWIDGAGNYLGIGKIGKLPDDFFLQIKALETEGVIQVRSRPQIATLNGHPADISMGQTQYYKIKSTTPYRDPTQVIFSETEQFQTIEANIALQITPWVSASGEITCEIHPDFKTPVGKFDPEIPPTIQSRALNSTVRLKDGETIVLGGLIQTIFEESESGIPIIKNIPLVGEFFKSTNYNKQRNELIIYVTPHLYYMDE